MSDYAIPVALVNPEWTRLHLDHPAVRFVEVDVDTEAHRKGHLPGAAVPTPEAAAV